MSENNLQKDVHVTICGEKITVHVSNGSYKAFNGKFHGKIVREDASRLGACGNQGSGSLTTPKASSASTFVVQSPKLDHEKLEYLKSILSKDYKYYSEKKVNQLFASNKQKGQLAVLNEGLVLVTKTIDSYWECCKVLQEGTFVEILHIPTGIKSSEISEASLKPLIKSFNLNWLGFSCRNGEVVAASFERSDVIKACDEIRKFAEKFHNSDVYKCKNDIAGYVVKHCSTTYKNVKLEVVDDGVKLSGSKNKIEEVIDLLQTKSFFEETFTFVAPNLRSYFCDSNWREMILNVLETKCRCSVKISQNEIVQSPATKTSAPLTQIIFEVGQGDITNETTDAIVNGVSPSFDLNWGKISPTVLGKAGFEIEAECSSNPLVSTDCLRVTKGYNLSCKYVFHLITPDSSGELKKRVTAVLTEAQKLGISSISFPTLGAGGVGLDASDVGIAFSEAFQDFQQTSQTLLTRVRLVVFEPALVEIFKVLLSTNTQLEEDEEEFGAEVEEWMVSLLCDTKENLNKALKELSSVKSSTLERAKIENDAIFKLEKHDIEELKEVSLRENVRCELKAKQSVLFVSGLKKAVRETTKQVDTLLRELEDALVYSKYNVWMWEEEDAGKFSPLPLRVSRALASLNSKSVKDGMITVCGETFQVNFSSFTLTSTKNQRVCKICEKEQKENNLPHNWSPMEGKSYRLIAVAAFSSEYKRIENRFRETSPDLSIVKIQRVQNEVLYQQYEIQLKNKKKHMQTSDDVARALFHGTSREIAEKICMHGFDRGFAGKNATAFGKGTYFAVNSCYSASTTYSPPDRTGCRYMFLADVLTGNYCQGNSSMVAAPYLSGNSKRLYDSVVDNVSSPSMFIVFRDASVYPSYLITFK